MDRWAPWLAAVVLVAAMAIPALSDPPRDGFPLSTYPMFATDRGEQVAVATGVGILGTGEMQRLSPTLLAGANEPILAVRTATNAVNEGRSDSWCVEIAERLAASSTHIDVVSVEVRTEVHDVMASVLDGAEPRSIDVHARCPVNDR